MVPQGRFSLFARAGGGTLAVSYSAFDHVNRPVLRHLLLSALWLAATALPAQSATVEYFPLRQVRLLDSPFKTAEERDLEYILALSPDRLLAPFLSEAGLVQKAPVYGNWEGDGLGGHTGGHYLSALSLLYASTGEEELRRRLDYMLDELKRVQDAHGNGYLGGVPDGDTVWASVARGEIDAQGFSLNGKWVPLYNIHKTYAGLHDAWTYTGSEQARELLLNYGQWALAVFGGLTDDQMQEMLRSEHGGLNESFADLYALTGDERYLELARRFSHRTLLDPLLREEDRLSGMHANTQIPKVVGFERIAQLAGDSAWHRAAAFFWETVVRNRTVAIGGNSVREHFHPADDFTSMIEDVQGPETCKTYNMLRLSKQLYATDADARYLAYYERALFNHILSSEHPTRGGFVYFTPMRPDHYRVYSNPQKTFWCCVGSGLESHAKYGELVYAHRGDSLLVNLFVPAELRWPEQGITVSQRNHLPDRPETELTIGTDRPRRLPILIRIPEWLDGGTPTVAVNGRELSQPLVRNGYVVVDREWRDGDRLVLQLPMKTRLEQLPDGSAYYAVLTGPYVMAARDTVGSLPGLVADDSRMGHVAAGPRIPLSEAPVLVGDAASVLRGIERGPGDSLHLVLGGAKSPAAVPAPELIPFFRVHDARYTIYWQVLSQAQLQTRAAERLREEAAAEELQRRTVDWVQPGEQQPEVEHEFVGERTTAGVYRDRHWRHAAGWFGYTLTDPGGEGETLRLTYSGADRENRQFSIEVNGRVIAEETLVGNDAQPFYYREYAVPADLRAAAGGRYEVRFRAAEGALAGGIFEVRLLR